MKLKLLSNFTDFMDHWFDLDAEYTLRRYTTDGLDRFCQLNLLERNGLKVPAYGTVKQLLKPNSQPGAPERRNPKLSKKATKLVVYTDEKAHCGEGKILLSFEEALELYPNCLASEYIESCKGVSWRLLQLGMHSFWLEYTSIDDWRSNCGEGDIKVIGHQEGWSYFKLPLFAIDFVIGDELYAVDFNVSPGIRGSGVEEVLSPKQTVETIKIAYFEGTYREDVKRYYSND